MTCLCKWHWMQFFPSNTGMSQIQLLLCFCLHTQCTLFTMSLALVSVNISWIRHLHLLTYLAKSARVPWTYFLKESIENLLDIIIRRLNLDVVCHCKTVYFLFVGLLCTGRKLSDRQSHKPTQYIIFPFDSAKLVRKFLATQYISILLL